MRLRLTLLIVAALAWAVPAAADYLAPEIGVRFPDAIGGFQRSGEPYRYDRPGLGWSLRYNGPGGVRVDVYVYDAGQRGIGTGIASPAVVAQLAQAEREMQAFYQQQRQPAQRVGGGTETLGTPPRQTAWLTARYDVEQGGRPMRSIVMVTGLRDHFIKIRATFPRPGKVGDDPLIAFSDGLSAVLAADPAPPTGGK